MSVNRLSRRQFLVGTGLVSAAVAGAGLTGCAGKTPAAAPQNEDGKQTAGWSFEIAPDPIDEAKIAETVETGILVIGAGPAGFSAALSALDAGETRVTVISKASTFNALGGSVHAINSKQFKALGFDGSFDKTSHDIREELKLMANAGEFEKWMRAALHSGEMVDWLTPYVEAAGFKVVIECAPNDPDGVFSGSPGTHGFVGNGIPMAGVGVGAALAVMEGAIQAKGGDIRYLTTAEQLERGEDGRVASCVATDKDGNYIRFAAEKGTILAAGCITQNEEMLQKFAPDAYNVGKYGALQSPNSGDGIKMALWVGAAAQRNWPWAAAIYTPLFYAVNPDEWDFVSVGATYQKALPGLVVNKDAKRFMNEDVSASMASTPVMKQPEMLAYTIWTKNMTEAMGTWYGFGQYYEDLSVNVRTPEEIVALRDKYAGFQGTGETPHREQQIRNHR